MPFNPQDFAAPARAQVDAAVRAMTIASDGAAKLFELHSKTARAAFDELTGALQSIATVQDPTELRTLATKAWKPDLEKTQSYLRVVYDQLSATQAELTTLVESQVTEFNKQMVVALDGVMKSAPAGSEMFVSAFKTAMSTANQAYETSVHSLREAGNTFTQAAAPATTKRKAA